MASIKKTKAKKSNVLTLGKLKPSTVKKKTVKKTVKNPVVKQVASKEIIIEEVIKETPKKNIKTSKTIPFTDIKKPEPLDIKYVWEIISFEVDNHNRVSKIVYDIIGSAIVEGVLKNSNCRNVLLVKDSNNNNPLETMDYRHLLEDQFMTYLKANISDRYFDHIKKVIKEKLEGGQIITKLHWNK